ATLVHLLRSMGYQAQPMMADRRYGADTHCVLLLWLNETPHLVDPGYLIVDPIPLVGIESRRIVTPYNELLLIPQHNSDRLELHTISGGQMKYRLTYKTSGADAGEFLRAWDKSFELDMMSYPVLTR